MVPADHSRVGRIICAAYDATGPVSDEYFAFLGDPQLWADGATSVFVAVDRSDVPVGAVAFVLPGDAEFEAGQPPAGDAGFRFLAVDPAHQGSGIGGALIDRCIDAAERHGCHRLVIYSMFFMAAAHRLYLDRGFDRRPDLDVRFPTGHGFGFTRDLTTDAADRFPAPGAPADLLPWYEDVWGLVEPDHTIC